MLKQAIFSGVLGGSLLLGGCTATQSTSSPTPSSAPSQAGSSMQQQFATTDGKNSINVTNQANGKSITIASATLDKQGFVMLLKTDADGNPTDMVGVSEAFSGTKKDIPIELMESFKSGDKLFAMLHSDANTNGKFEWPGSDQPLTTSEGSAIMQDFKLQ